jgi:hypothetical protein
VSIWSRCLLERASKDARKGEDELMLTASSSFVTCSGKSGAVLVRVLGSEMLLLAKGIWAGGFCRFGSCRWSPIESVT